MTETLPGTAEDKPKQVVPSCVETIGYIVKSTDPLQLYGQGKVRLRE